MNRNTQPIPKLSHSALRVRVSGFDSVCLELVMMRDYIRPVQKNEEGAQCVSLWKLLDWLTAKVPVHANRKSGPIYRQGLLGYRMMLAGRELGLLPCSLPGQGNAFWLKTKNREVI